MASSRSDQTTPSALPTLGSSPPEYSRQSYDSTTNSHKQADVRLSSSASLCTSSISRRANSHQSNSTHSGYLDRAQLFGRTPVQRYPQPIRPTSISCLEERPSRTARDEWIAVSFPEPRVGNNNVSLDVASGLICTPSGITTLDVEQNTPDRFSPIARTPTIRKTSPAEVALREQFEKRTADPDTYHAWETSPNRKSKWACRTYDTHRSGLTSPKTSSVASGDEPEFEYVDPPSLRDELARVKAHEAISVEAGRAKLLLDVLKSVRDKRDLSRSYFNMDVQRRSRNALFRSSSVAGRTTPTFLDEVFPASQRPVNSLSLKTPTHQEFRCSFRDLSELSFSPVVTAVVVAPLLSPQNVAISPVSTTYLSLSSITTTISQRPTTPRNRAGISFAQATAIIYCCMAITASQQLLLSLSGDIAAMNLIIGLYRNFFLGNALCVVLHLLLGAGLRRVPGDVLQRCGRAWGFAREAFWDGFEDGVRERDA